MERIVSCEWECPWRRDSRGQAAPVPGLPWGPQLSQRSRGAQHTLSLPNDYGLSWVALPNVLCSKNISAKRDSPALGAKGCLALGSENTIPNNLLKCCSPMGRTGLNLSGRRWEHNMTSGLHCASWTCCGLMTILTYCILQKVSAYFCDYLVSSFQGKSCFGIHLSPPFLLLIKCLHLWYFFNLHVKNQNSSTEAAALHTWQEYQPCVRGKRASLGPARTQLTDLNTPRWFLARAQHEE